jgi:hypothetical protein
MVRLFHLTFVTMTDAYGRWLLTRVTAQVFSQSLRQMIDFVHCGVEYHASFTKQSLSSTLKKSLAVTNC